MIQLQDLDLEMTEVLNDEWELVNGADGSGSVFDSPFMYQKSNYVSPSAVYNNSWMAPLGSGSTGTGSTLVGIQGSDGNGNVFGIRQGGTVTWKNQYGTGVFISPGAAAVSLGFSF